MIGSPEEQIKALKSRCDYYELNMLRYMIEVQKANRGIKRLKLQLTRRTGFRDRNLSEAYENIKRERKGRNEDG